MKLDERAVMIIVNYFILINLAAFLIYGLDKWKAKKGRWRISEISLISLALLGGSIGALLAIKVFKHKTRHKKFTIGIPAICVLQLSLLIWLYYFTDI